MHALVVHDGSVAATELLAKRIAGGLRREYFTAEVTAGDGGPIEQIGDAHLVVLGAMSPGLFDDWIDLLDEAGAAVAMFTVAPLPVPITLPAMMRDLAARLVTHGLELVAPPRRFAVDALGCLHRGELVRASEWGRTLAARAAFVDSYA